jgi:hypothetical protein
MLKTILKILKTIKLKCSSSCCKSKCDINIDPTTPLNEHNIK